MKTESKTAYHALATPSRRPPTPGAHHAPSHAATQEFGRAALGLVGSLATLCDPVGLLPSAWRPMGERSVRVLTTPDPAGDGLTEEQFRSAAPQTLTVADLGGLQVPSRVGRRQAEAKSLCTIEAAGVGDLDDVLLPVKGGHELLATAMMPPRHFCGIERKASKGSVDRLCRMMDAGQWVQVAQRLAGGSPQRVMAMALAACAGQPLDGRLAREAKGSGFARTDSLIIAPHTRVPEGVTPLAMLAFDEHGAVAAVGSTYAAAQPGSTMDCQDGVYLSPHATVVTDGLGGHPPDRPGPVRVAQAATGRLVTQLVEAIARTEARPAEFLRLHVHALLKMVDEAVASALVAPYPETQRADNLGVVSARAAFVAVAHLRDGTVAFGVGDCTAHLFCREANGGLHVETFTPEPNQVSTSGVAGLGERTLGDDQIRSRPFPPGVVERVIVGSDGVFDQEHGHLELVEGRAATAEIDSGRAKVGKQELSEMTAGEACTEIVTRLTRRTRAFWQAQEGSVKPDTTGLDDLAIVVRDTLPPAQTGGVRKKPQDGKSG